MFCFDPSYYPQLCHTLCKFKHFTHSTETVSSTVVKESFSSVQKSSFCYCNIKPTYQPTYIFKKNKQKKQQQHGGRNDQRMQTWILCFTQWEICSKSMSSFKKTWVQVNTRAVSPTHGQSTLTNTNIVQSSTLNERRKILMEKQK